MWTKLIFVAGATIGILGASRAMASEQVIYEGWFDFDSELEMFFVTTPTEIVYIPYAHTSLSPEELSRMVDGAKQNDATNTVILSAEGDVLDVII